MFVILIRFEEGVQTLFKLLPWYFSFKWFFFCAKFGLNFIIEFFKINMLACENISKLGSNFFHTSILASSNKQHLTEITYCFIEPFLNVLFHRLDFVLFLENSIEICDTNIAINFNSRLIFMACIKYCT
jgi:hypothetical protein